MNTAERVGMRLRLRLSLGRRCSIVRCPQEDPPSMCQTHPAPGGQYSVGTDNHLVAAPSPANTGEPGAVSAAFQDGVDERACGILRTAVDDARIRGRNASKGPHFRALPTAVIGTDWAGCPSRALAYVDPVGRDRDCSGSGSALGALTSPHWAECNRPSPQGWPPRSSMRWRAAPLATADLAASRAGALNPLSSRAEGCSLAAAHGRG